MEGRDSHGALSPREGFWAKVGGAAGALGVAVAIFFGVTQGGGGSESGSPPPTNSAPPPETGTADSTLQTPSAESPIPTVVSVPPKPQPSATLVSTSTLETENKRFVDLDSGAQVVGTRPAPL